MIKLFIEEIEEIEEENIIEIREIEIDDNYGDNESVTVSQDIQNMSIILDKSNNASETSSNDLESSITIGKIAFKYCFSLFFSTVIKTI